MQEKRKDLNKEKGTHVAKRKGEKERKERKSQCNQKYDNGVRGKSFRPAGAPWKIQAGCRGERTEKRKEAYEEGRLGGEDRGRRVEKKA